MLQDRLGKGFIILVACMTLMAIDIVTPAIAPAGEVLTMNVNREGTSGYAVGTTIAQTISKYSDLKVSGVPYTSPVAGFRDASKGKCDIPYGAALDVWQANNAKGPYAKSPPTGKSYQGIYYIDGDLFWITRADRDDIKSMSDIAGKKVFPGKMGSGISEGLMYMLESLDIKIAKNVQMGYMEVANALKTGLIDVAGVYVVSRGQLMSSWVKNVDSQVDIKIIEPNDAEVKKLTTDLGKYGIGFEKLAIPFKQDVGLKEKETFVAVEWWGWHFASSVSTDDAYTYTKTFFSSEVMKDFSKAHALLKRIANVDRLKEQQIKGINSVKQEPVHPGVAKFLKEIGIWQDDWKVGK